MEVGEISVAKISQTTHLIKPFASNINIIDCPKIMSEFNFTSEGDSS